MVLASLIVTRRGLHSAAQKGDQAASHALTTVANSLAMQHLAALAEEAAPLTAPEVLPELQRDIATRASLFGVRQPVFP